ncbi:glycosyltransferase [Arthrobacter sp. NA-172]|uniref:glycosyltransferase family protein n=1 Tax=Arthrobacter sp. NA-172 TaxID=3367524 RepID=UPI0037553FD2
MGSVVQTLKRILFVSHSADGGVFKVGSHHLAREMALTGANVAHVSTPWSLVHRILGRGDRIRRDLATDGPRVDEHGVVHACCRTLLPSRLSPGAYLERLLLQIGFEEPDLVLIDQPLMDSRYLRSLGRTRIYRPTDLYTGGAAAAQRRLVRHAHGVVATSQPVLDRLPDVPQQPRIVVRNGVEYARFASEQNQQRSGAVYVGAIDGRFDWQAVVHFALASPAEPFTIIGPVVNPAPACLPPNVIVAGPVPYHEIPAVLAQAKVGLLPFTETELNAGRSPMKLFEYLAAGLFVVGSRGAGGNNPSIPGFSAYASYEEADWQLSRWFKETQQNVLGSRRAFGEDWASKAAEILKFADRVEWGRS